MLLEAGHLDTVVAQHVGEHDGGAAGMGDDCAAVALDFGIHEHTAHGGQFLTVLATDDTSLAEQGVDGGVVGGQGTGVARGGTAAGGAATALDGGNVAALVDEAAAMLEETLRVANLLHIEHDYVARLLGVECLVEVLQHILDTQLGAVTHCPHAIELEAVAHTVFLDEHGGGTATGDEVHTLGIQRRNGGVEAAGIVHVEEAGAVGADERTADTVDGVDNVLLDFGALVALLRETGADDDEALAALLLGQHVDRLGAELGGDAEDGAVHLRQVLDLGVAFHALHFGLFGVHGVDLALEGALQEVLQRLAAGFMYITGSTADNDAAGIE